MEVPGYIPSPTLRRQVELIHRECVFPHCHRPATGCDLDHVVPYARGGPTCSCNVVPLCRRHHRYKTHAGWRLERAGGRLLLWTSPHGRTYTVHAGATDDITPVIIDPASSRSDIAADQRPADLQNALMPVGGATGLSRPLSRLPAKGGARPGSSRSSAGGSGSRWQVRA